MDQDYNADEQSPVTIDDSNFGEVSPSLFGPEFAQKSKELVGPSKSNAIHYPHNQAVFLIRPLNSRGSYRRKLGGGTQNFQKGSFPTQGWVLQKNSLNK